MASSSRKVTQFPTIIITKRSIEPINLVLFGRVGNGKSSLGNSIIRKTTKLKNGKTVGVFEAKTALSGVTTECRMETTTLEDAQVVNVIDTPGIFDVDISKEKLRQEIIKCMHLTKDGIHGFILVFSVRTRFSEEEKCAIKYLQEFFGDEIVRYMIVVFTGGDELEEEGRTLQEFLSEQCPQALKDVLDMCNHRVVLFDNKTKDEQIRREQVRRLMPEVQKVLDENNGKPFTNEFFEELKKLRSSQGNEQQNLDMHLLFEQKISSINKSMEKKLEEVVKKFTEEIARLATANERLQQDSDNYGCSIL